MASVIKAASNDDWALASRHMLRHAAVKVCWGSGVVRSRHFMQSMRCLISSILIWLLHKQVAHDILCPVDGLLEHKLNICHFIVWKHEWKFHVDYTRFIACCWFPRIYSRYLQILILMKHVKFCVDRQKYEWQQIRSFDFENTTKSTSYIQNVRLPLRVEFGLRGFFAHLETHQGWKPGQSASENCPLGTT